ncbi:MAG: hypothetical protein Q8K20_20140 [Gemmobacter sp.]|nr:hypothetical protein [Gemmobacter sp.]
MTYVSTSADAFPDSRRPFARMLDGFLTALSPRSAAPAAAVQAPAPGPAASALIDADFERMAGFGSWEALRDNLRESANAPPRKRA